MQSRLSAVSVTAAPPEPLTLVGLADEIAYRLRADILEGRLPLGAPLRHEQLAARFGVSRTPIREALHKLQATGLVELSPNRGAVVRTPARTELIEVYELRADLEGLACELACARASDEELGLLEGAQARLATAIDEGVRHDEASFDTVVADANGAFHGAIHRAARNGRLHATIDDLQHFFPRDSVWRAIADDPETLHAMNVGEHERIAAALRARRPAQARRAMRAHVAGAGRILLAYLDAQRFWG
jgi:DNA-binding GntR family transcriptional regulator